MAKRGKKSKYELLKVADKLESVRGWALHGGKTAVAKALGVGNSTITAWIGKYPEFAEAVSKAEQESNGMLLSSAFQQALGCYREVTEVFKVREEKIDPDTKRTLIKEEIKTKTYTKYFPPDPRMTQFMLSNRFKAAYQKNPEPSEETKDNKLEFVYESVGEDFAG